MSAGDGSVVRPPSVCSAPEAIRTPSPSSPPPGPVRPSPPGAPPAALRARAARTPARRARTPLPIRPSPPEARRHARCEPRAVLSHGIPPVSCVGVQPSCKGERSRSPEGGPGMAEMETPDTLRDDLRTAWHRYIDQLVPLRPALYGYCRRLAGNVWDTEDLVQDTLLRPFGHWGVTYPPARDPRAYLLRTAQNVWIDTLRRRETVAPPPTDDRDA